MANSSPCTRPGNTFKLCQRRSRSHPAWQTAVEALLIVVTYNGPTMFARIGMMQALYPKGERVFTDRKDHHWGKRKLKRDN